MFVMEMVVGTGGGLRNFGSQFALVRDVRGEVWGGGFRGDGEGDWVSV